MRISLLDTVEQPAPVLAQGKDALPETVNGIPVPRWAVRATPHGKEVSLYTGRDCTGLCAFTQRHNISAREVFVPRLLQDARQYGAARVFALSKISDVPKVDAMTWRQRGLWR